MDKHEQARPERLNTAQEKLVITSTTTYVTQRSLTSDPHPPTHFHPFKMKSDDHLKADHGAYLLAL
jgi:hypothetical protein